MEQMRDACLQIHGRMTLPLHPSLYFEQPQLQKKLEGNGPIDLRRLGAIRIYQVMLNNFLLRYLYY